MDSVNFKHNNIQFDIYRAKCKHFYKLLVTVKVKLPNMSKELISDFDISNSLIWTEYTHFHKALREKRIFGPSIIDCLIIYCTQIQNFTVKTVICHSMINTPSVALQTKSCITSYLNAPMCKTFGKHSPLRVV